MSPFGRIIRRGKSVTQDESGLGTTFPWKSRARLVGVSILGLTLLLPLDLAAQGHGKVWRIGLFHVGLDHIPPSLEVLRERLKVLGYEEGKNIRLDFRNLADEEAALVTVKEFVRERVDLIVAFESQTVRAAKAATSEIPIVFVAVPDPVAEGFVKSLSHPGGNITGPIGRPDFPGKRMELFNEMIPGLSQLLVLTDSTDPAVRWELMEAREAAVALKLRLIERDATTQADIERVFRGTKRSDVGGVIILSVNLRTKFPALITNLALQNRLPLAMHRKEWVEQGALFSYGTDTAWAGQTAARYVDRILKGAKPADLPVEYPMKFELVINLKTAKQLGLTIPQSVLYRADKVIK